MSYNYGQEIKMEVKQGISTCIDCLQYEVFVVDTHMQMEGNKRNVEYSS